MTLSSMSLRLPFNRNKLPSVCELQQSLETTSRNRLPHVWCQGQSNTIESKCVPLNRWFIHCAITIRFLCWAIILCYLRPCNHHCCLTALFVSIVCVLLVLHLASNFRFLVFNLLFYLCMLCLFVCFLLLLWGIAPRLIMFNMSSTYILSPQSSKGRESSTITFLLHFLSHILPPEYNLVRFAYHQCCIIFHLYNPVCRARCSLYHYNQASTWSDVNSSAWWAVIP